MAVEEMKGTASWAKEIAVEEKTIARMASESLDALYGGRLKLFQSRLGYRVSLDALLLVHFASVGRGEKIVDLGTGNGVIGLALAQRYPSAVVTGIELQAAMAERARRNVRLNELDERVRIISADVRDRKRLPKPGSFDIAVCNPPYRKPGSGRVSVNDERRTARHELNGDLGDFLRAGALLLRNKGCMALVYLAARSADAILAMRQAGIEPKRLCMVHSFAETDASLILLEGVKGGKADLVVLPPMTIYRRGKAYTDEVTKIIEGGLR